MSILSRVNKYGGTFLLGSPNTLTYSVFNYLYNKYVVNLKEADDEIKVFHKNIVPNPDSFRRKSSSFSKALTILYTLQGSIDFEKDLGVAKSLFQIYEYTRVALIEEFKSCKITKSDKALTALVEIRDSWQRME